MFGKNAVIPGQFCDKLSCRQVKVYGQMDGRLAWWMARWQDADNGNTPLAWKAKGVKIQAKGVKTQLKIISSNHHVQD